VSALVFGGTSTAQCMAVSDYAAESKVLFVSIAPLEDTAERKFTLEATIPRRCIVDDVIKLTTEELKLKTVAILGRTDEFTTGTVMPGWKKGLEAAGIKVVYSEAPEAGTQDFTPYLTKIKYYDPDVFLLQQSSEESMAIAKQIMELGGWGHTQVVAQSNSLAASKMPGAKGWLIMVLWHPALDTPESVKFKEAFQAANGKLPDTNHLFYYLGLWTAIQAIELAGTAEDTEAIALAARSGNLEFDTPVGRAHYNTEGDSGLSGTFVQVQEGGTTVPFKQ
jgi:branched-chain amino acid transport system substrate-binding protein